MSWADSALQQMLVSIDDRRNTDRDIIIYSSDDNDK